MLTAAAPTSAPAGMPDARFAKLARGVNLSHWYAQSLVGGYPEEHLSTYVTDDDAQVIADSGFTHVRLTLDESVLFDPTAPGVLRTGRLDEFDRRVRLFTERGLAVVVDLHPGGDFKEFIKTPEGARTLVADWSALAKHLAERFSPEEVFLEICNEPGVPAEQWYPLQGWVLAGIRQNAPQHTVIVTGGGWGGMGELVKLVPYDDANVVYTFHWYEPFLFTHQDAGWTWDRAKETSGLPWPIDPQQAAAIAEQCGTTPETRELLRQQIASGKHTRAWITKELDRLSEWQKAHGFPRIYVGEFGVYKKSAPQDARLRWHEFVVDEFEKRGWAWSLWDYSGGFGVASGESGRRQADQAMLEALGLVAE